MSVDSYRRQIESHLKTIAKLQSDKGREADRAADYSKKSNSAAASATRASSSSSANSYLRTAQSAAENAAKAMKNIANIEDKIAREQSKLHDAQKNLTREEQRESTNRRREEEKRIRETKQRLAGIRNTLTVHEGLHERSFAAIEKLTQLPERITVLFMAANPLDQLELRLDEEVRAIEEMIRKSAHRESVELKSCWAVRPLDVLQALNEHSPRIVHFSGHGSDQDEIIFQDSQGMAKVVSKEAIVQTMAAASGEICLVFFNTCYSRNQAEAVVKHIPAAIGMKTSIGDVAARVFSAQFYSAIGFGLSVLRAFQQAKAALMLESIPEHDTPELFLGDGVDGDLLYLVAPPNKGAAEA